jgi:PAS domain S-box-containing protein
MVESPSVDGIDTKEGATMNSRESQIENATNILNTMRDAYLRMDGEFRFTFVNRAAEALLGVPVAALLGKTPWEVRPETAGTPLEEGFRRAKAGNTVVTFENYFEPWKRWYAIRVMPDSSGGLVVQFQDITDLKRTEQAAMESGRHFHSLFENMAEGVAFCQVLFDGDEARDWVYHSVNAAYQRITGLKDVVGKRVSELMPGLRESNGDLFAILGRVARTGEPERYEAYVGPLRIWLSVSAYSPQAGYFVVVLDNITDRKRMQDALLKSEEKFARAFRSSPAIVTLCDLSEGNRLVEVNEAFELAYGYRREEAIGRSAEELGLWVDAGELDESRQQFQDTSRLRTFERRFRRKNGDIGTGLTSSEAIEIDGKAFALSATIDITEKKAAEARLEAQNKRFQGIIEHTDAGYFRIGMDGCYQDVNPAWLRMHGFTSKEEAIGLHFSAVQNPADMDKAKAIAEALIRGESVKSGEFSRLRRDGGIGYHTFSANPVLEDDRVVGIEGFLVDISEQKTAEQEKQHSELRYRSLFNSMQEGVAVHRLICANGVPDNYVLLDVNRRYEEILSVKRDHVVSRLATVVYGTPDAPYLKEFASVVESGSPYQFETYFPPMDKYFVISVAPMGESLFATIFFDITEQKRTQQAIQQANESVAAAERHYRLVFNSVSDAVFVHRFGEDRVPGNFLEVNDNACCCLGYTREELLRMRPSDVDAAEEHPDILVRAQRILADRHLMWEGAHITKDGRRIPVEVNTHLVDLDGSPTIISSVRDISDRIEAERKYQNIFDGALEGIYRTSTEGKILAANPALAKMLGYESAEETVSAINGSASQVWADPDERTRCIALLEDAGSIRDFECQFKRKDGTAIPVSINARKVSGVDGKTLYYDGFIEDITERKRAEAEKAHLEEQFRQAQKLESVGRLAGGVAHDFNNLLTVINGYSDLLLKQLKVFDPLHPYALEIKNAGDRAAGLTKQLLAFSRKQVIEPRVFDLNTTIRQSAPMLQRLIGEDIALETHLDASLGQVLADPDQIHQVIMNLAVNARDAMPDGGRLDIATANVEHVESSGAAIRPGTMPGRYVLMTVTDNGHGMDEATRQRIFEPFFTTKEVGKGTGLGLATVYGIVRQGGGWIDVSSEVGAGASFQVYLPRSDGRPDPGRGGIGVATERGKETILLVEDQKAVLTFTVAALKRYGYHVLEASDGEEALSVARQYAGELHLLLTDVIMPGMNGKVLSERLKELYPNLKVLFTSGYTADAFAERGVLDRGVPFLHKPFAPEEVAGKVREVLDTPPQPPAGP